MEYLCYEIITTRIISEPNHTYLYIHLDVKSYNNDKYSVTYHSILRYPLAQQWRLLNFCVRTYSRELSSFVNCNHVELFWKVSITQKSSTPFTPGKLNMVVIINPNITQRKQAVFIPSDSALEAVLEHDTIFTPVVVTLKVWLRSYCNQFSFLIYSRFINPAVQKMAARKFEIISRNNKYTYNFVTHTCFNDYTKINLYVVS